MSVDVCRTTHLYIQVQHVLVLVMNEMTDRETERDELQRRILKLNAERVAMEMKGDYGKKCREMFKKQLELEKQLERM